MVDESRLLHSLLYVLGRLDQANREFHKIFKILWFADISHMRDWGRLITGDTYIKMEYGPVPSCLYDIFKGIRDGKPEFGKYARDISVRGYKVAPLRAADLDNLSETDIEKLDKSIEENSGLSMGQLTDKSHGAAWEKSEDNQKINLESIFDEVGMPDCERGLILESHAFARAFSG
jgi:uncharacterized phage-associated protein